MLKGNQTVHYKMYKKGRFWVFAGIVALTWQVGVLPAKADTSTASETPVPETTETTSNTSTTGQTATLKTGTTTTTSPDTTNQSNGTSTDNSTSNQATVTDGKTNQTSVPQADTTNHQENDQKETRSSDQTNQKSDTSTPDVTVDPATESKANSADSTVNSSEKVVTQPKKDSASTSDVSTEQSDASAPKVDEPASSSPTINQTQATPASLAVKSETTPVSKKALLRDDTTVMPAKDYTGYQNVDAANKGVFGTSEWWIDGTVLHIGEGVLADTVFGSNGWNTNIPWVSNSSITSITIDDKVTAAVNSSRLFFNMGISEIKGLDNLDTSQVENMSFMFSNDYNLTDLDLTSWGTKVGSVKNMSYMFQNMGNLTTLKLDNWQTGSLENLGNTFSDLSSLQNLSLASSGAIWNTSHVENMNATFADMTNLVSLDVSGWNVSKVSNFQSMFARTGATQKLQLTIDDWNWKDDDVTDINMSEMFSGSGVTSLDLSDWDMSNVTDSSSMLSETQNLKALSVGSKFKFIGDSSTTPTYVDELSGWLNTGIKQMYTSQELMSLYSQTGDGPAATYQLDRSRLEGMDFSIYQGDQDFDLGLGVNVYDSNGDQIGLYRTSLLTYEGQVDVNTLGEYPIAITYVDDMGQKLKANATVTVVPRVSQAYLTGQNTTIVLGKDNIKESIWKQVTAQVKGVSDDGVTPLSMMTITPDGELGMDGIVCYWVQDNKILGYDETIEGRVYHSAESFSPTDPGTYDLLYAYMTSDNVQLTHRITVKIMNTAAMLKLKSPTIVIGPDAEKNFSSTDYFDSGMDGTGTKALTAEDVTFSGLDNIKFNKPGEYQITANYTDAGGNIIEAEPAMVTVVANDDQLSLKPDVTLVASPTGTFDPMQVIETGKTTLGETMTTENGLTIISNVDPQKAGNYTVTASYKDASGNITNRQTIVTVVDNRSLQTQPVTLTTKQALDETAGILSAKDSAGNDIDPAKLTYDIQNVNTEKAGTYTVNVSYTDDYGNDITGSYEVVVQDSKLAIQTQPVLNLRLGENFDPSQAVLGVTANGETVANPTITYDSSKVDVTKAGTYQLKVSYQDQYGNSVDKLVPVNISAVSLLLVDPVTVTQGDSFDVHTLVKSATDALGQTLPASALTYTGTVNTAAVGDYPVTVSYQDQFGNTVSQTLTVTVKAATVTPTPDPDPSTPVDPEPSTPTEPAIPIDPEPTTPAKPTPTDPKTNTTNNQSGSHASSTVTAKHVATPSTGDDQKVKVIPTTNTSAAVPATATSRSVARQQLAKTKAQTLPQTNEQSTSFLAALGLLLSSFTLAFFRKRH
ncbi:hypothetical protein (plasmid) [Lactobacillus plantarum subsp. plantarum] [Lactiplantibacillus mudanjiangensis]|uniref:bacterial Ig-like domain-containing protein n=1 Tax=Lactiplantibacillus mudanjiangensis TaxID=1296538 RepID=UPI001014F921|nr:hypothetical protein (plasmid) [Lactobacillus plantarum subsp. plantarum] [Lactiplantibacillus mudanjiangensis]